MSLTEQQLAEARQQILSLERQLEGTGEDSETCQEEEEEEEEELEATGSPICSPGWSETVKLVTAARALPEQASWRNRYEEIETVL